MSGRSTLLVGVVLAVCAQFPIGCTTPGPIPETSVATAAYPAIDGAAHPPSLPLTSRPAPRQSAEVDPELESRAYVLVNRARKEAGLTELEMRLDLIELARKHALDMAERRYFAHESPEGTTPGDRARDSGIRFRAFAENLARVRNSNDPCSLSLAGWLASPGHRRNLLDEGGAGYRYTGVGVAVGENGQVLLAQVFLK